MPTADRAWRRELVVSLDALQDAPEVLKGE